MSFWSNPFKVAKNAYNDVKPLLSIAAPIAGSLLLPGVGTALGIGGLTAADGAATALGGALGGGIGGAAGGALSGGGLSGALKGGVLGGAGGYLLNGGLTSLGNSVGGAFGDSTLGTDIGNGFSSILGGSSGSSGLTGTGTLQNAGADSTLQNAPGYTPQSFNANFDPALGASPASTSSGFSSLTPSGASSAGIGGGVSSYGGSTSSDGSGLSKLLSGNGLQIGGSLVGAANSLYANSQAQKQLQQAGNNANAQLAPYTASGAAADNKLSSLLGTGATGSNMTSADILAQSPQYQFQLQQGNQALDRKQAASGNYFSGAALKDAQTFGQGLANQTAQQYYGELAGQAGQGQNAAGTAGNIDQNIGNAQAGATINSANITNQTLSSLLSGNGAKQPYIMANGQIGYR